MLETTPHFRTANPDRSCNEGPLPFARFPIQYLRFERFKESASNELAALGTTKSAAAPLYTAVKTFDIKNSLDSSISLGIRHFAVQALSDTVGIIAYCVDGNDPSGYKFFLCAKPQPVLHARTHDAPSPVLSWGALATFMRPEDGEHNPYTAAASAVLIKSGLQPTSDIQPIGGPLLLSNSSIELNFPGAVAARPIAAQDQMFRGSDFEQLVRVKAFGGLEILNGLQTGLHQDLLAFVLAGRFLIDRGDAKVDLGLKLPNFSAEQITVTQLSAQELRSKLISSETFKVEKLKYPSPPITAQCIDVRISNNSGQPVASFIAETFDGEVDTLNVSPCFLIDGEPCLLVNLQFSPPAIVRNTILHPVYDEPPIVQPEVLSIDLNTDEVSLGELTNGLLKESGLTASAPLIYLGHGTFSSSFNPGMHHLVVAPVDPTKISSPQDNGKNAQYIVRARDVVELAREGTIRGLPFIALAQALCLQYGPTSSEEITARRDAHLASYYRFIRMESPPHSWIHSVAPDEDNFANRFRPYAAVKEALANTGSFMRVLFPSGVDKYRDFIPYGVETTEEARRAVGNSGHDGWHYWIGSYVPWRQNDGGSWELRPLEVFRSPVSYAEELVSCTSDYSMPHFLGSAHVAEYYWRGKVAQAFELLGYNTTPKEFAEMGYSDPEVLSIFRSIVGAGVIPDEILESPFYDQIRESIVGRLLCYSVLNETQIPIMYQNFADYPEFSKIVLRICHATNDPDEYKRRVDQAIPSLLDRPPGLHPLKTAFGKVLLEEVRLPALMLAYLKDELIARKGRVAVDVILPQVEERLSELVRVHDRIKELMARTGTVDPSTENGEACLEVEKLSHTVLASAKSFLERLMKDERYFGADEIKRFKSEPFPYIRPLNVDPATAIPLLRQRERENFARIGKPYPYENEELFPFALAGNLQ